jgi:signal transduction histidine kinase
MLRLITKIVNAGVTADKDVSEANALKGLNGGVLISILGAVASMFFCRDSIPYELHLLALVCFLSVAVLLNFRRFTRVSRVFFIIANFCWITVTSVDFGGQMAVENYFYVTLVCFLIFEARDSWRFFNAALSVVLLVAVKLYQATHIPYFPLPRFAFFFYINNIIFPCAMISMLCGSMVIDMKQYQAKLINNKKLLKGSNELKDKILSIIGHDMRSPLNSLRASLELLSEAELTKADQAVIINGLKESLSKSERTLNELLEWSSRNFLKATDGMQGIELPQDVHAICNTVLHFYSEMAEKKNVTFVNQLPPGTFVIADHDHLIFLFRNLIGNALKFSHGNGTALITIWLAEHNGIVEISITDNGVGIPEEILKNLFKPEKRITTDGTFSEKGTGLGLLYCREFAQSNGGELKVSSEHGKGSTFTFTARPAKPEFREIDPSNN